MSKVIEVLGKNAVENIRASRLSTIRSNLTEDCQIWRLTADLIVKYCAAYVSTTKQPTVASKRGHVGFVRFAVLKESLSKIQEREVGRVISTFASRVKKTPKYSDYAKRSFNDQMICVWEYAEVVMKADPLLQGGLCRAPSRQSIDQDVQLRTLQKYLGKDSVGRPANGNITVRNGKLIIGRKNLKDTKTKENDSRSIDVVINTKKMKWQAFMKYGDPATGGSSQSHQHGESLTFLSEAKKYVAKHRNNIGFVVISDGLFDPKVHPGEWINTSRIRYDSTESFIDYVQKN